MPDNRKTHEKRFSLDTMISADYSIHILFFIHKQWNLKNINERKRKN